MTGRLRLRVFRLDRQLCGAEIRTADVSSGPRVTVRRHASNLPLGGPGGGSPPASRSGRAATGLVSDRKLTEFTPKQSGSPCSRPGPTDPVQSSGQDRSRRYRPTASGTKAIQSEASRASMRASLRPRPGTGSAYLPLPHATGHRSSDSSARTTRWPRPPICRS